MVNTLTEAIAPFSYRPIATRLGELEVIAPWANALVASFGATALPESASGPSEASSQPAGVFDMRPSISVVDENLHEPGIAASSAAVLEVAPGGTLTIVAGEGGAAAAKSKGRIRGLDLDSGGIGGTKQ